MNEIVETIKTAHSVKEDRNWDTLYVIIDIHGTVMKPNYDGKSDEWYPHALDVLRYQSEQPVYKLIMWTCSIEEDRNHYVELLKARGINIDYVNENPEVIGKLQWGDYTTKMYANIGYDDKFGFNPHKDWIAIKEYYGIADPNQLKLAI